MNKTIKYAITCGLLGGSATALINLAVQQNAIKRNPKLKLDFSQILLSFTKGVIPGAVIGSIIGERQDRIMKYKFAQYNNLSNYLEQNLNDCNKNKVLIRKADQLREDIYQKFEPHLSTYPSLKGSIVRGTPINGSDADIEVRFNKSSGTIAQVNENIENYLLNEYDDSRLINVRRQKHSVGLTYELYSKELKIDVVTNREIENGKGDTFIKSKRLSIFDDSNLIRTNSSVQFKALRLTNKQQKIIQLLKKWKKHSAIKCPSILLELIVVKVFKEEKIPYGLEKGFFTVVKYLANNITSVNIIDPSNSKNIISNSLSHSEKEEIRKQCFEMLINLQKHRHLIFDYLPEIQK